LTRGSIIARWGLIPYWAKDIKIGFSTSNARAESRLDLHRRGRFVVIAV